MMVFSEIHDWQEDKAVKQVLVFSNGFVKEQFEIKHALLVKEHGATDAPDSDIGAVYKIRAVRNSDGKWISMIRCGFVGIQLWEKYPTFDSPEAAITAAKECLFENITEAFKK